MSDKRKNEFSQPQAEEEFVPLTNDTMYAHVSVQTHSEAVPIWQH